MSTPENLPRLGRGAARAVAGVLLAVATLWNVLAWTPASWWTPLLGLLPVQVAMIAVGALRDALGVWTVVVAVVALVLLLLPGRPQGRRGAQVHVAALSLAVVGLVSTTLLWTVQVASARAAGADVGWVSPVVPFTRDLSQPDREVVVGTVDGTDLTAEVYLPADGSTEDPHPVVVRVHGGGFDSGAPSPSPYFGPLLDRGFAVLDVSYRLASPQERTWDLAVADVGCALAWIGTEGSAAGLDPDQVGLMGESAGGQLAVNAGNMIAEGTLEPSCGAAEDLPDVGAVVAGYPAVDGSAAYGHSALGAASGDRYVGGGPEEFPDRYALTDSVNHLGPSGPPLLIYQGTADHLILPQPVQRFAEASNQAGIETRYVELPGQEHTTGGGLGTLSFGGLVGRDLAVGWFVRHLD